MISISKCLGIVVSATVLLLGCVSGVPVAYSTVPPTDTTQSITAEEAAKVNLGDLTKLIDRLEGARKRARSALDIHCGSIDEDDLPLGYNCLEYAEHLGTRQVTCSAEITTPVNETQSVERTCLEMAQNLFAHSAMLNGVLDLPDYSRSLSCLDLVIGSTEHFICLLEAHVGGNYSIWRSLRKVLYDLGSTTRPSSITCQADASVPKQAPLGVLWTIRAHLDIHLANARSLYEKVRQLQGNP